MIIPPDPEKDPNLFSDNSSTSSLLDDVITRPRSVFSFASHEDHGEALPPYERQRLEGHLFADPPQMAERRDRNRPSLILNHPHSTPPSLPLAGSPLSPEAGHEEPYASTSTARLPLSAASGSSTAVSSNKLWEGSNSRKIRPQRSWRKTWKKWRKWVYLAGALVIAGIGVTVGLLVGLKAGKKSHPPDPSPPWEDTTDGRNAWVTSGQSLNITYIASRDGPGPNDGNLSYTPPFVPLNASSSLELLAYPYPAQTQLAARFIYPFTFENSTNATFLPTLPYFTMVARGLGSSGTVEIVGSDSPAVITNGGLEGNITVDVVVGYSGYQDLDSLFVVGTLIRDDGFGLGIYTPTETDGKVSNAYMLNPMLLPSFHVVIRLPPSAYQNQSQASLFLSKMHFELDRMAVRLGNLQNVVDFGSFEVDSGRGGVVADYAAAESVAIWTGDNSVRGRWNISESIIVNSTQGSVISEIILFDPASRTHVAPTPEPIPSDYIFRRDDTDDPDDSDTDNGAYNGDDNSDLQSSDWASSASSSGPAPTAVLNSTNSSNPYTNSSIAPTHTIHTTFVSSEGFVSTVYLAHPPRTALEAFISTDQGDVDVSLHPNYVGPFIVNNAWGQVRLVQPAPIQQQDPLNLSRTRTLLLGPVDPSADGLFAAKGFNASVLLGSASSVSGAAAWTNSTAGDGYGSAYLFSNVTNMTITPQQIQKSPESGGEVLIMGAWGNVQLGIDGQS